MVVVVVEVGRGTILDPQEDGPPGSPPPTTITTITNTTTTHTQHQILPSECLPCLPRLGYTEKYIAMAT